jgi:hypothetical protein
MLGTFAGSVALTFGARGGVYVMGGIVPKILGTFTQSSFRERFEFRGRYRAYLSEIPTFVVTRPNPAFLGLSTLFANEAGDDDLGISGLPPRWRRQQCPRAAAQGWSVLSRRTVTLIIRTAPGGINNLAGRYGEASRRFVPAP